MLKAISARGQLAELIVVFVGVVLAFAVENLREDLNERNLGAQYLKGFRQDLLTDSDMLRTQLQARQARMAKALVALEFFEGRPIDAQGFFEAHYRLLLELYTVPNRNTMDAVLNSGNLRPIDDADIRGRLLNLYSTYERIARIEEHMARDFDLYLYDPAFSSISVQFIGPWEDSPEKRLAVATILGNVTIENGVRLVAANLQGLDSGLLGALESAQSQIRGQ